MSTPVIVGVDCSASARACAGKLQHLPNRPAAAPMRSAAGVSAGRLRPDPDQPPLPRGNAAPQPRHHRLDHHGSTQTPLRPTRTAG
jgi:hypothetical protein